MTAPTTNPWDCRVHETNERTHHAEQRLLWVVALTFVTMIGELIAGYWTGSLALVADGWHMASHAGALALSAGAYRLARAAFTRRFFVFGTGKVYALAGYTNAVALGLIAVMMAAEGIERLQAPQQIAFREALFVAIVGLVVNLASVLLLSHKGHGHDHHHAHAHGPGHHHGEGAHTHDATDHNLRSAYAHVLADALTSLLAIAGLLAGWRLGWTFLDPMIALVASAIIMRWAVSLCRSAARQLLDLAPSAAVEEKIRRALGEVDDVCITDMHLWELGPGRLGCVVSIVTATPREVGIYRNRVLDSVALSHLTIEVHRAGA